MTAAPSSRPVWLALALLLPVGCGSCGHAGSGAAKEETAPEKAAPEGPPVGTIEGVVRLAPGAALPERPPGQPDAEGQAATVPEDCPPPKKTELRPVTLGADRGLEGVLVSATGFDVALPHEPTEVHATIRDCRLEPPLVVGQRGDSLIVTNQSNHAFMPRIGAQAFQQVLTHGQSRTIPLERGGSFPLFCAIGIPCGLTDVVVLYHPVYAVTTNDGHFRIDNVPAGEKVTLHAWHPLFREATAESRVGKGRTVHLDLTVEPAGAAPAEQKAP